MRTFMTLMTLGAAGTGYAYLQQSSSIGEPSISRRFDWGRPSNSGPDVSQISVDELRGRIRERTRSVLDEFANQQSGHSDAPVDDAFQRLKQLAQSAVAVTSRPEQLAEFGPHSVSLSQVPQPDLDELQRTAFDPSLVEANPINLTTNEVKPQDDESTAKLPSKQPTQPAPANREPDSRITQEPQIDPSPTSPAVTVTPSDRPADVEKATAVEKPIAEVSRLIAQTNAPQASVKPMAKRETRPLVAEWKVTGKTTEGRPMHSIHLGQQGTRTLVIAGLNGDDRTAVHWVERLADDLKKRPELFDNNEIVLFRAGNPDGLVKNLRNNARGVPLNRNFPSRRYRPVNDIPKFAVPASEVETRVILETFYSFRPRRVIHLTSTTGDSLVLHNRLAKNVAEELERSSKLKIQMLDAEQFPGSVEDFLDGTLEAAVVSMRLGIGSDWQNSWSAVRPQILAAVVGRSIEPNKGAVADATADPDRTPIPATPVEPVSRRPRRGGYEELPAPPF
ncbi:M14 family zinc carboxypeptidase [Schlesneria paludicola]|uniref:M14 family zinc carboxypeptidase n=1 Tax=Schlesneria paludicola TaxID=360056 RepID=UPI0003121B2D|nr:M14 family zinc carboxypeptidase [Schlesneria paludicola]